MRMRRFTAVWAGLVMGSLIFSAPVRAEKYLPAGYGAGQNAEGNGWGLDLGYKKVDDDYYATVSPTLNFSLGSSLFVGIQAPLELLVVDKDPKQDQKTGSIRKGTYDSQEDYAKIIAYVRHGEHLFFRPGDAFNWSFYYGKMNDGYIGHRTIIDRYVTTYDPAVYRAGFMADINNDWGGVEVFYSDALRNEVSGTRGYIRPFGILGTIHDLVSGMPTNRQVAMSSVEMRDPDRNGGFFFQEDPKRGGSMQQQTHKKFKDEMRDGKAKDRKVQFKEVTDPLTGKTQVRAVEVPMTEEEKAQEERESGGGETGPDGKPTERGKMPGKDGKGTATDAKTKGDPGAGGSSASDDPGKPKSTWGPMFLSRWALGYTIVKDVHAPLALEKDGSNQLVIDPDTQRPRGTSDRALTITGVDTEFRLSPFRWLDLTPYADLNKIQDSDKHFDKSQGLHVGLEMGFKFSNVLKFKLRPEYRELSSNYIPTYFDSYYAIERTVYNPGGDGTTNGTTETAGQTKLTYLRALEQGGKKKKGYYVNALVDVLNVVVVETTYEDYDGVDNSRVFTGIYIPNIFGFFLNGYYQKKGFNEYKEAYIFDDRSLAAAEVGYIFFGLLSVKVSYQRTWVYDASTSAFKAQDEKQVGFGISTTFQ